MTLRDADTAAFATFAAAVGDVQTTYLKSQKRYFQGIATAGDTTKKTLAPDPRYADVQLAPPSALTVQIDVYDGPQGRGYVVVGAGTDAGGQAWECRANVGPEVFRDSAGWQKVVS